MLFINVAALCPVDNNHWYAVGVLPDYVAGKSYGTKKQFVKVDLFLSLLSVIDLAIFPNICHPTEHSTLQKSQDMYRLAYCNRYVSQTLMKIVFPLV